MKSWIQRFTLVGVATALMIVVGCKTTSHHSIRVYEYSDEPPSRPADDKAESEYEMVSPGEMVGPGQMVDDDG